MIVKLFLSFLAVQCSPVWTTSRDLLKDKKGEQNCVRVKRYDWTSPTHLLVKVCCCWVLLKVGVVLAKTSTCLVSLLTSENLKLTCDDRINEDPLEAPWGLHFLWKTFVATESGLISSGFCNYIFFGSTSAIMEIDECWSKTQIINRK